MPSRPEPCQGNDAIAAADRVEGIGERSRLGLREWLLIAVILVGPLLALQIATPLPRVGGDAVEYMSLLHSLGRDHDLDLSNEFAYFGILDRWDKRTPTSTGRIRTIYAIGPAVLWLPFYWAADWFAPAGPSVGDGLTPFHLQAVRLGSLIYAGTGLVLLCGVLLTLFDRTTSVIACLLLLHATFLSWYVVDDPFVSHAGSFGLTASALAVWWRWRGLAKPWPAALLGLLLGLAFCVRPQNGIWLILPLLTLLRSIRVAPRPTLVSALALGGAFTLGALPQLLAWKILFGQFILDAPPQGADYIRWGFPHLWESLLSSRHGLLFWTPVLWGGFLGFGLMRRRHRDVVLPAGLLLIALTYVNVCIGEWWAGGSFSNRRFDSALPLLALGLAASVDRARDVVRRHPLVPVVAFGAVFVLWNSLLMEQYRRDWVPADGVVAFDRLAQGSARVLREGVGTPLAWPANWVFAWRHGVGAGQWDELVGQYLFFRQNNLGGRMELGLDEGVDDHPWLAEGWLARVRCGDAWCRPIESRARLLVPLDEPEALGINLRAAGQGELTLSVNGRILKAWHLDEALGVLTATAPAAFWRRDLNDLTLSLSPRGSAQVDWIRFERRPQALE